MSIDYALACTHAIQRSIFDGNELHLAGLRFRFAVPQVQRPLPTVQRAVQSRM